MHHKFHTTQTWTFKSRTQTITSSNRPELFPGPATYNYDKPEKYYGAAVIGKDKRQIFSTEEDTPGPGAYLEKSFISDGPKRSMSARHIQKIHETPGPTSYEPNHNNIQNKPPSYSLNTKQPYCWSKKQSQKQPGPSSYNPQQLNSYKSVVVGNSKRKDLNQFEKTPGPGAYNSNYLTTIKRVPQMSLGSARRRSEFDNKSNNPAPNKYIIVGFSENQKKQKKGYTMRPMTADPTIKERSKIPGPGNYTPEKINNKSRGYSYGTSKRKTFIDNATNKNIQTPAPGSYKPSNSNTTAFYSIGNSKRKNLSDYQKTPGPAVFNLSDRSKYLNSKSPGYSIGKSNKGFSQIFDLKQHIPGPNKYTPNMSQTFESIKSCQLSKSNWIKQGKGLDAPGVGVYDIGLQKSGGWTFKKEKRVVFEDKSSKQIPGSNKYEIKGLIPNPPKYMMSGMYKSKC